jgi:hypothetical protein
VGALTATKLFGRSIKLTIGSPTDPTVKVQAQFNDSNSTGLDISGFSIQFVVEKSLVATDINTCAIKIYNLSEASRQQLSGAPFLTVLLEAGYIDGTSQLYFAGARSAWSTREGASYVTHIESADTIARPTGLKQTKKVPVGSATGSIYRTRGAKVPLSQALNSLVQAMGIGLGNLAQVLNGPPPAGEQISGAVIPANAITAVNGSALLGNSARRMTDICRSAGLEWSVQDGQVQILNIGKALSSVKAIQIDDTTGLINSPSVDSQGALELTTLLIPGLAPGVLINVKSLFVSGGYRIEKIRYEGNTSGQEWYAHIAAAKY